MVKMDFNVAIFVTVSLCIHIGLGGAFNIVISPDTVNGLVHPDVTFKCAFDSSDATIKEIMVLDLSRDGKAVAIIRYSSKVSVTQGLDTKFQAEGNITNSVGESYLQVTMSNPELKDSGPYTCLAYYLDVSGLLKEKKASANLTVSNDDIKFALMYLVEKVSTLETELSREKNESRALTNQVSSLTNQVSSLTNQMKSQEQQLQQQEQKDNLTVLFTAVYNTPSVQLTNGQDLVFGKVILNQGQAYDGNNGTFTAPVAGYYMLHLSVFIYTDKYIYVDLQSGNGKRLKTVHAGDYHGWPDYSDGSCLARLEAGEKVKPVVKLVYSGGSLLVDNNQGSSSYNINTFSGYLLKMI